MDRASIAALIETIPQGLDADDFIYKLVNSAVDQERETCAMVADIALLGAERSLSERVVRAIRARGEK